MNEIDSSINLSGSSTQESERLKLIIEAAQVGTWDFNPMTGELIWDNRCKALFGLPPDAKIDYDVFLSGLHPDDRDITDQVVQEALRPGSTGRYNINYRTIGIQDGQLRWIRANGRAFFDQTGKANIFIGTVIDVTENYWQQQELERLVAERTQALQEAVQTSKRQETLAQQQSEELLRSNTDLRHSNENLRQFAQIASHDLQEPLRKIQTFSDVLLNQFLDNLADGERDMIRRIQKSAHRMQMLVKDLLTYSQIATNRDAPVPVNLSTVVTDVIGDLEIAISERQAKIDAAKLPTLLGSSSRYGQLLQNLIANALKFAKPDQPPLIVIRAQLSQPTQLPPTLQHRPDSFWLITVSDNGIGFDEKYKDRIFNPFQRLHDTKSYSGTGIGLAICQRVVESYGGAIDVTSQPGIGSVFKIYLPTYDGLTT
ncbi:hypothetical protein GCM10028807_33650 [Spirosoma daeguense]